MSVLYCPCFVKGEVQALLTGIGTNWTPNPDDSSPIGIHGSLPTITESGGYFS